MYKIDLHTHSTASPDGGLRLGNYAHLLEKGVLDSIAITDHDTIDFALKAQAALGDRIIVGEEIHTSDGEIIGLYLKSEIPPRLSIHETIQRIKEQAGLVYVPHPFETIRHGLHPELLDKIHTEIDIMEICNGRAFVQNRRSQAVVWAKLNHVAGAASSDAHGLAGIGKTYTAVKAPPTRETMLKLLHRGTPIYGRPTVRALMYPKYNKLRKRLGR